MSNSIYVPPHEDPERHIINRQIKLAARAWPLAVRYARDLTGQIGLGFNLLSSQIETAEHITGQAAALHYSGQIEKAPAFRLCLSFEEAGQIEQLRLISSTRNHSSFKASWNREGVRFPDRNRDEFRTPGPDGEPPVFGHAIRIVSLKDRGLKKMAEESVNGEIIFVNRGILKVAFLTHANTREIRQIHKTALLQNRPLTRSEESKVVALRSANAGIFRAAAAACGLASLFTDDLQPAPTASETAPALGIAA